MTLNERGFLLCMHIYLYIWCKLSNAQVLSDKTSLEKDERFALFNVRRFQGKRKKKEKKSAFIKNSVLLK